MLALTLQDYRRLAGYLAKLPAPQFRATARLLCRTDLYWLIRYAMNRPDLEHPWLLARCREIQASPDGYLDLWARAHYKSTIITFGKTIQDILASHGHEALLSPAELTFGIFSHTRPIAKAFLRQVKQELQSNELLLDLFPDVLFRNPERDAPRWSEDAGLVVRRRSNPKEATLEAWGLVDGQPTGKHFNVLIYDDVVTLGSVSNPDMIRKVTEAWELSLNLGDRRPRKRIIGTRYHFADTYRSIMDRGAATPRVHPATVDGTATGLPVLLTADELAQKFREMGPYAGASQLLLNPVADSKQSFKREWLEHRYQDASNWRAMNRALLCDPANEKKRTSDYTAMAVIGKAPDGNLYLLDALRDRLNIAERAKAFIELHRRWKPMVAGYERYGIQADVEYIKLIQERENYRFEIQEVGGQLSKVDRVNRLIPYASEGRFWLPVDMYRTDHEGRSVDLVRALVEEELLPWPVPLHDDLADAIARVFDLEDWLPWPRRTDEEGPPQPAGNRYNRRRAGSWMAG
jgi:predicted phage terminase large subunit-like protein